MGSASNGMNFNFLVDALFPRRCLRCHTSIKNGIICKNCHAGIALNASLFCGKCRARIPRTACPKIGAQTKYDISKICHKDFPYLLGAAASYGDETMKTLIHCLKFRGIPGAAEPLAEVIEQYLSELRIDLANYSIVPIPLSPKRQRERGFNQSELIGMTLAKRLHVPLENKILVRTRHTAPQSATENATERKTNVRGCFMASNDSLYGKNIIILDDVTTSGATFFEAALAAKRAGAKKIIALAAAMP